MEKFFINIITLAIGVALGLMLVLQIEKWRIAHELNKVQTKP